MLDRHPRLTYEVARLPFVWGAVSGVLAGEIEGSRDAHGLARPPLRSARDSSHPGGASYPFRGYRPPLRLTILHPCG